MICEACEAGIGPAFIHKHPTPFRGHILCRACVDNWQRREKKAGHEIPFERFLWPVGLPQQLQKAGIARARAEGRFGRPRQDKYA